MTSTGAVEPTGHTLDVRTVPRCEDLIPCLRSSPRTISASVSSGTTVNVTTVTVSEAYCCQGFESSRRGTRSAMGFVISLILIAFGAILAWAVNSNGGRVDPQVVGGILMIVGVIPFVPSSVVWRRWWGAGVSGA